MEQRIGIIGGSGLYSLFDNKNKITAKSLKTPFGKPSCEFSLGKISGRDVAFLPRHGKHHSLLPHEVNYPANIYGMKMLGVTKILSISAVGSLREDYKPRDVVIVDQFFDRTTKRPQTFFGNGFVAHVAFGDPVCSNMRKQIIETSKDLFFAAFHTKGTYVNMEGPQFSTRAESDYYRKQGFDIIGMTNMSEARLAREAEICYASLSFVTDYDCWHKEEVTTDRIIAVLKDNAENAKQIIKEILKDINPENSKCKCANALQSAMITPLNTVSRECKKRLFEIIKKYL